MNPVYRRSITFAASLLMFASTAKFAAAGDTPRQVYDEYEQFTDNQYEMATYYYKPVAELSTFRHHYAVREIDSGGPVYLYNPYIRAYYGLFEFIGGGTVRYRQVPKDFMRKEIREMNVDEFPITPVPNIPESTENVEMLVPPH